MGKARKRTIRTIVVMTVFAIIIVLFYYYWSNRTDPLDPSNKKLSEIETLLNKDLVKTYPETPREVSKLFGSLMKALYSKPEEDEVKALALKIRDLYDGELLNNNPEDTYLTNLYTDIADWKEKNRKITNYILVNEDQEQRSEVDGVKYATTFISYTIQENVKFTEVWKVLLRQDENERWKILGWELVPEEDSEE